MIGAFRRTPLRFMLGATAGALLWALWTESVAAPLVGVIHVVLLALSFFERQESGSEKSRRVWGDDSYEVIEKISEGGMGVVYRARHLELRRDVALKQIQPERLTSAARARFKKEARVLSGLTNPHTINVFDAGMKSESTLFYVMELLDGFNLQQLVEQTGEVEPARVIHILRQATMSLNEAHMMGLVHRDLKPANIMICRYGGELDFIKVLDFGLVKTLLQEEEGEQITVAGELPGTPAFLAPEGISGSAFVDARADIYSLAAVGHYLLTARLLFEEKSPVGMARAHLSSIPMRASEGSSHKIPVALDDLLARCLKKDPLERPQSAAALLAELEELSRLFPWTREQAGACWSELPERFTMRAHLSLPSEELL